MPIGNSLSLFMTCVLAATPAELAKLKTICGRLFVLSRDVVAAFAIRALQYDVIPRHKIKSPIP